jgi:outer membrane protein assembly factor BamB
MRNRRRTATARRERNLLTVALAAIAVITWTAACCADGGAGGDWPTYRHDTALSAISPLEGGLGQPPRVAWSIDLGGPRIPAETALIRDVTGDGQGDILILGNETVECRQATGQKMWKLEGYSKPSVADIRDYAGDGSPGIVLTTTVGGRVETFMIDGRSGRAIHLWKDENNFGGHTRYGKLLAGVAGAQVASTSSGQTPPAPYGGHFRLVSFEHGLDRPHFRIRKFLPGDFYSPLMLFDDLDGDGAVEMVVISHEALWTFDTENGEQELTARYAPMIRTYYASIASAKLSPADRNPALVMINPHLPGLEAVRQDGKLQASRLWKVVVGGKEDQYQSAIRITPGGPDVVADLDGDGRPEVLASITNEHGDGLPHLVVFDAATGRRLVEAGNELALSVDDLDGDGRPEVLLRDAKGLRLAHWEGNRFRELWRGDRVEPLLEPLPSEGTLSRTSGGNTPVWRESTGSDQFLFRFPDGVSACRLEGARVIRVHPIVTHEALGNRATDRAPGALQVGLEGQSVVTRAGSTEVYRYELPAPQTYLAPPPLVADLSGSREIVVRDSSGKLLLVPSDGGAARVQIANTYEHFQTHVDPAGSGPTICDMDGDGDNEIVTVLCDTDGKPYCAVLDGTGKLERRIDLEPGTRLLNRGPTGSLGPGRGRWIVLRMFYGEGAYSGRRPLVVAFDGKTGAKLWVRDHYASYGPNPVVFAAHLPTAVHDLDGDGADDWLVCSENFYGVISVKDNRDLVGPVVLSDALPGHWTAYSYPSVGKVRPTGELGLLHNNSYSLALITDLRGKPIWHHGLARDTAGTWGILADVNGDGVREFIHAQPDGLIRCFDASAPRSRCVTCPEAATAAGHPDAGGDPARWLIDLKAPTSRMSAADLDADGRHELVFGGSDGNLYALAERSGRARILWKVSLGRRVGEPVLADLDGDGRAEILVTTEAGRLYCLRAEGAGGK